MQKGFIIHLLVLALIFVNNCKESTKPESEPEPEFSVYCADVTEIPKVECEALVAFFDSTNGSNWGSNDGWLENNTPCSWSGVECNSGHVDKIKLFNNQLNGSIPIELGNLTNLTFLFVNSNQLSGSIPTELGDLTMLTVLDLGNNQLSGSLPLELGKLTSLEDLFLEDNQFEGSLPLTLTNLKQLNDFRFHNTNLCEPPNESFQNWISQITNISSTGITCTTAYVE